MGTRTARNSCENKVRHATREAADKHRQGLVRAGAAPGGYRTYPCKRCDGFHVGHAMPATGRRRRG